MMMFRALPLPDIVIVALASRSSPLAHDVESQLSPSLEQVVPGEVSIVTEMVPTPLTVQFGPVQFVVAEQVPLTHALAGEHPPLAGTHGCTHPFWAITAPLPARRNALQSSATARMDRFIFNSLQGKPQRSRPPHHPQSGIMPARDREATPLGESRFRRSPRGMRGAPLQALGTLRLRRDG
jgi:hypothetical protein